MHRHLIILVILLFAGGCAWFGGDEADPASNWTVERLYDEAKSAMESGYYNRAVELFEFLETRFPFGVYGQQSLLDLAYAYYKTENYEGAISACDRFIRLYPQNDHVAYAHYLKGLVNFNRGGGLSSRFLPLDVSQRDTTHIMTAFQDFRELVERFPNSRYTEDARQRMVYLRNVLGRHEVNVARYYMRRGSYVAALNRASYTVQNYARTPSAPDALALMARAYKVLEMDELSRDTLRVLELNYPDHPGIERVRRVRVTE